MQKKSCQLVPQYVKLEKEGYYTNFIEKHSD
jgi:hypothetical protein